MRKKKRTFFAEAAYFIGMLLPPPGAEIMERGIILTERLTFLSENDIITRVWQKLRQDSAMVI